MSKFDIVAISTPKRADGKLVYANGEEKLLKYGITEVTKETYRSDNEAVSIILPSSVVSIGDGAFEGFENLKSIILPESVTEIGSSAFSNCMSLESIEIPREVLLIGKCAFCSCRSLESVKIPFGIEMIERDAFNNCENLRNIYYDGTKKDWQAIFISKIGNGKICGKKAEIAKIHYKN